MLSKNKSFKSIICLFTCLMISSFKIASSQEENKPNIYGFTSVKYAKYTNNNEPNLGDGLIDNTFSMFQSNIFVAGNVGNDWKYMLELMIQNDLTKQQEDGQNMLHQGWLEWKPADEYSVRAGRMLAPFGYFNNIHSRPNLYWFIERPFAYEEPSLTEGVSGVRFEFANLAVLGLFNLTDDIKLDYAIYGGNTSNTLGYAWDLNSKKQIGGRVTLKHENINLGFSMGNNSIYADPNDALKQQNSNLIAIDLQANYSGFNLIAEMVNSKVTSETRANVNSNYFIPADSSNSNISLFATLGYDINESWVVYTAYDSFTSDALGSLYTTDTPLSRIRAGFNFKPNNSVLLKAEFNNYPYSENNRKSYNSFNLGAVLTF